MVLSPAATVGLGGEEEGVSGCVCSSPRLGRFLRHKPAQQNTLTHTEIGGFERRGREGEMLGLQYVFEVIPWAL